jgi:hypothetical protein
MKAFTVIAAAVWVAAAGPASAGQVAIPVQGAER